MSFRENLANTLEAVANKLDEISQGIHDVKEKVRDLEVRVLLVTSDHDGELKAQAERLRRIEGQLDARRA